MADLSNLTTEAISAREQQSKLDEMAQSVEASMKKKSMREKAQGNSGPKSTPTGRGRGRPPKSQQQNIQDKPSDADLEKLRKERRKLSNVISGYWSSRKIVPLIQHLRQPAGSASIEELKNHLDDIRDILGSRQAEIMVTQGYLFFLKKMEPLAVQYEYCPPGTADYIAHNMDALSQELEEIAIEYGDWFKSGPISRLFAKTMLLAKQAEVEFNYSMTRERGERQQPPAAAASSSEPQQQQQQQPAKGKGKAKK